MKKLAPSILSANFANLLDDIKKVEDSNVKWLHIDIMDGHFVPNISFGPIVLKAIRPHSTLFFDVHLMIEQPERYIEDFVHAGADMIVVHQEACPHLHRVIQQIKSLGVKAGVALNPATPVSVLEDIIDMLDMVLIMSVNPGFGGQRFIPNTVKKVKQLKQMIDNRGLETLIEIDGGVNLENAKMLIDAGVDVLVAGSAVFCAEDVSKRVSDFHRVMGL